MSISIETLEGLQRRVTITVAADKIEAAYKEQLKGYAKNARVDGFRKGKVPHAIIEQRFGLAARQDVLSDEMQRAFFDAVIAEKINLAGRPTFTPNNYQPGQEFSFTATFEVFPEVELKGLENIEVEKPVVEITEADLDKMIDVLRKQQATWAESQAAAQAEDRVVIDFVGSVDGEEFEGGKATDFTLAMGQDRMIPGFEEGIVGHKAGEQFDIDVTFPEEYHAENLKGKAAKFAITLKKVENIVLPELTEEFVKKFGSAKTVEDLRAEIKKNMQRELKNAVTARVKNQVINGLIAQNEIEVPAAAVAEEVDVLRRQAVQRFGGKPEMAAQLPAELFEADAKRRVQVGLLLSTVIGTNELKVDEKRVEETIAEIASAYEQPAEVVAHYAKNRQLTENIRNVVLEEQAVEVVLAKAKVTEKATSFDEVMAQQAQG
ncbi:trigger factor [Actinobacillus pleuropneumoniae]|uniref:Trigger factor n=1 Tax=Actinobacillus pleuropneumoniae serotype 5b (strain L20) TaxID=416269 RepID=TIG_ACTP2|nr:trigger factor [Actinobacillus pleuropneumoniae]A3N2F5.1 RecName: Full=Trigger factor; Short=TF; AltName: Full=PPIase [Actinobacillus pleuropneumoniae serovar 5b str. L20]ABN74591.1 trigger factor [Actinobacillus pleuropneumoniae serovar 5b str. L20]MEE3684066.1 trigger factor [Actinobacillus pleuropneumoniae]QSZ39563.1 trigger factor [Actinobacillus pleuropneumoniae]UKH09850.1 trigger factor [Actinobacillus pleuropneumoniae]UPK77750.1 trigger factor [Actinobacillus pleuropneumoniae]